MRAGGAKLYGTPPPTSPVRRADALHNQTRRARRPAPRPAVEVFTRALLGPAAEAEGRQQGR